jgi:tRNA 2-thiouridine synthesizing protein A
MSDRREGEGAPARTVDVRGEFCPVPVIETAKAVKQVEIGEIVLLMSTDRGVQSDMPAWCKATGHELLDLVENEGVIEVRVRRRR